MTPRITPTPTIPATFPIGGSYHCITRRVHGTPHTLYCIYRTIDVRELGRQISWPCIDDASRLERRYEAWLKATKGKSVSLNDWKPEAKTPRSKRGSSAQQAAGWAA